MNWESHEKCGIWDQNALLCTEQEHLAARTLPLSHCWAAARLYLQLRPWFYESKLLAAKLVSTCISVLLLAHLDPSAQLRLCRARSIICGTILWTISGNLANLKTNIWCWQWFSYHLEQPSDWVCSTASTGRGSTWTFILGTAANSLNWNHCCLIVKSPCKEVFYSPGSLLLTSPGSNI